MVNRIYEIKNKLIERIHADMQERGVERIDHEMVDMVKDLAEAEAYCMKAKYYDEVVKAMAKPEAEGYGTPQQAAGYSTRNQQPQPQGYMSRGFHEESKDVMGQLRAMMQGAGPDERERLRNEALTVIGTR